MISYRLMNRKVVSSFAAGATPVLGALVEVGLVGVVGVFLEFAIGVSSIAEFEFRTTPYLIARSVPNCLESVTN